MRFVRIKRCKEYSIVSRFCQLPATPWVRVRFLQTPDGSAKRNDGAGKGVATDG
jgi:hypothetical protein